MGGGGLRPVFRGLQLLWLTALITSFMTGSALVVDKGLVLRMKFHPPRLPEDLEHLLILLSPAFFLALISSTKWMCTILDISSSGIWPWRPLRCTQRASGGLLSWRGEPSRLFGRAS